MRTIKKVKDFNREGYLKYQNAVAKYEFGKGGFPFLPMYQFRLENGENRKIGYVVSNGDNHKFFLYHKDLEKYINEVPNREFQVQI